MTIGQSTWYFDVKGGGLARVDASFGTERWTMPTDLREVFPALTCFGLARHPRVGTATGVFQTGPNELVLVVLAGLINEGFRAELVRPVRFDVATGTVTQYPASFGSGLAVREGWRSYRTFDNEAWEVFNTVTNERITRHAWTDSVFSLPGGGTAPLPADSETFGIADGRLYLGLSDVAWSYRVFDLDNLVTDGITYGIDDPDRPRPRGFERAWSMTTDPDTWLEYRPAEEFSRDILEAINTAALRNDTGADALLAVMNAESGLRTTAYHPAGRYGLLQLTADQLSAAGWTGTPDDYLTAGIGQIPVIHNHLGGLRLPVGVEETGLWLLLLIPQLDLSGVGPDTVIAAPGGPRPELFRSHGVADVDGDGRLTVEDMRRYLRSKHHDPRLVELRERTSRLGAVIPDWPTLTEVNEGDEMGIVRPSAAQLGFTVHIFPLRQQPGFDHEQVVSIDPPAGTLAPLGRPILVTVNLNE